MIAKDIDVLSTPQMIIKAVFTSLWISLETGPTWMDRMGLSTGVLVASGEAGRHKRWGHPVRGRPNWSRLEATLPELDQAGGHPVRTGQDWLKLAKAEGHAGPNWTRPVGNGQKPRVTLPEPLGLVETVQD